MNGLSSVYAMIKADFLERTRRSTFLVILCLVIYLGYSVNTGQVFIQLDAHRGIYNSAWVGSMMALVITFFLGIFGFYLVKNTIQRDEQTGVGQIIATDRAHPPAVPAGKVVEQPLPCCASLVLTLALAAILMQLIQREDATIQLWALVAPFLFVALPMMALVAAFAVFFEDGALAQGRLRQTWSISSSSSLCSSPGST